MCCRFLLIIWQTIKSKHRLLVKSGYHQKCQFLFFSLLIEGNSCSVWNLASVQLTESLTDKRTTISSNWHFWWYRASDSIRCTKSLGWSLRSIKLKYFWITLTWSYLLTILFIGWYNDVFYQYSDLKRKSINSYMI